LINYKSTLSQLEGKDAPSRVRLRPKTLDFDTHYRNEATKPPISNAILELQQRSRTMSRVTQAVHLARSQSSLELSRAAPTPFGSYETDYSQKPLLTLQTMSFATLCANTGGNQDEDDPRQGSREDGTHAYDDFTDSMSGRGFRSYGKIESTRSLSRAASAGPKRAVGEAQGVSTGGRTIYNPTGVAPGKSQKRRDDHDWGVSLGFGHKSALHEGVRTGIGAATSVGRRVPPSSEPRRPASAVGRRDRERRVSAMTKAYQH